MESRNHYTRYAALITSFFITKKDNLVELAYGLAPGSRENANNVLRRTIRNGPPTLDRDVGNFSKMMKVFVDTCLSKDPIAR